MNKQTLGTFFEPQSIAVVGASRSKEKVGRIIFENISNNFSGKVYPVNPKAKQINSKKSFASLKDLPESVDLAVVALPAKLIPKIINQGVEKEISNYILYSAGFSEKGEEGEKLATKVNFLAKKHSLNILGPNTLGFLNSHSSLNATFSDIATQKGGVSFISQSGALISILLDWALEKNVGLDLAVSLGNKLDLNENSLLTYLNKREQTKVIAVYLESFINGKQFLELANQTKVNKPIILLKGGKTEKGQESAKSHTGKVSGSFEIARDLLKLAGVMITEDTQEFYNLIYSFSRIQLKDNDLVIITNAGGAGVVAADSLENKLGKLTPIAQSTKEKLTKILPDYATIKNPIDIAGDANPERYYQVLKALIDDPVEDAILLIISPQAMTEMGKTAKLIKQLAQKSSKPIFVCLMGGEKTKQAREILKNSPALLVEYPEEGLESLCQLFKYHQKHQQKYAFQSKPVMHIDQQKKKQLQQTLAEAEKGQPLAAEKVNLFAQTYQINLPPQKIINNKKNLKQAIREITCPWVLKTNNIHKTDRKEIYLDLKDEQDAIAAFEKLASKTPLILQQQINSDCELLLGAKSDQDFGRVVLCGLGGIYTEILEQTVAFPAPASKKMLKNSLKQAQFYPMLREFRGRKKPFNKILQTIHNFTVLADHFPEVTTFEINPLLIKEKEIYAVDFRIIP